MENKINLTGLYKSYKTTSDDEIRDLLKKIKVVMKTQKGIGTIYGYYFFDKKTLDKIKQAPRNNSLTFDANEPGDYAGEFEEIKTIPVLVKSSSRFFFKPDIGEVFDVMTKEDREKTDAVFPNTNTHYVIEGSSGEHFIMEAVLLKKTKGSKTKTKAKKKK